MEKKQETEISNLITWINFIMTIFIVFLHSDCSYMISSKIVHQILFKSLNTLYDLAVPCFFVISSYLFYKNITDIRKQYKEKIYRRVFSLIIPYLLFSIFWMILYTLFTFIPFVGDYVPDSIFHHNFLENLYAFLLADYDPPIWYIRTLFALQVISPLFYLVIKKRFVIAPVLYVCFIILNIVLNPGYSTPLFWIPSFIVGIWYAIYFNRINSYLLRYNKYVVLLILITFYISAVASSIFWGQTQVIYYLYRVFASILFIVLISNFNALKEKPNNFTKYSFFVFMIHYPIVQMLKRVISKFISINDFSIIVIYIISAVTGMLISFGAAYLTKKYCTKLWKVVIGGR